MYVCMYLSVDAKMRPGRALTKERGRNWNLVLLFFGLLFCSLHFGVVNLSPPHPSRGEGGSRGGGESGDDGRDMDGLI